MVMTANMQYVDVHINQLAYFIFMQNTNDAIVELSLENVETNKDLFFFCLDLFCKGLVLKYGTGSSHVEIGSLQMEDFEYIQRKLQNAGIIVHLDLTHMQEKQQPSINMDEVTNLASNLDIREYCFKVQAEEVLYKVSFELIHTGTPRT